MLTGKQEQYAALVASGQTQSAAYRQAYKSTDMQKGSVWSEASRLMRNPQVAARVAELKNEGETVRRVLLLDREEAILAQLEYEALTARTDSARIRALELLGRHAGMFAERVEVERVDRTAEQIEADVRVRLSRLGILTQDGSSAD